MKDRKKKEREKGREREKGEEGKEKANFLKQTFKKSLGKSKTAGDTKTGTLEEILASDTTAKE